jgi:excisionase family DNA binding protein
MPSLRSSVISAIKLPYFAVSVTREDVLTVTDVAALLDLKPYTVKEYTRRGILPGRKLGRTWRFLRPELEEAIRRLPRTTR